MDDSVELEVRRDPLTGYGTKFGVRAPGQLADLRVATSRAEECLAERWDLGRTVRDVRRDDRRVLSSEGQVLCVGEQVVHTGAHRIGFQFGDHRVTSLSV